MVSSTIPCMTRYGVGAADPGGEGQIRHLDSEFGIQKCLDQFLIFQIFSLTCRVSVVYLSWVSTFTHSEEQT